MVTRSPCNVTPMSHKKGKNKCSDANGEEEAFLELMKDKKFTKALTKAMRPRRETNWLLVINIAWLGLSYLSGLYETASGIDALGYLFYHLLIFLYLIVLSFIPFFGLFTLITAGGTIDYLSTTFNVSLANGWIVFGVNGLYAVIGWIIQIIIILIVVGVVIALVRNRD